MKNPHPGDLKQIVTIQSPVFKAYTAKMAARRAEAAALKGGKQA